LAAEPIFYQLHYFRGAFIVWNHLLFDVSRTQR
jgi:hypothetical protein